MLYTNIILIFILSMNTTTTFNDFELINTEYNTGVYKQIGTIIVLRGTQIV